ncbi:MAG: cytidine deaminase [Malacoplasma sp.]|nr:cytidine deaminase [Malacoplasma sp.]
MNNLSTIFLKLKQVISNAYVPYSNFRVAAICQSNNECFFGVNVENASYPVGVCAERNAIAAAVSNGVKKINAIYLLSDASSFATPCGMCRQFMSEFMDENDCLIYVFNWNGEYVKYKIEDLLKDRFNKTKLDNKNK